MSGMMGSSKDKFILAAAPAATGGLGVAECAGTAEEYALADETAPPPEPAGGPLPVYLPACGVLCDIFWWARR